MRFTIIVLFVLVSFFDMLPGEEFLKDLSVVQVRVQNGLRREFFGRLLGLASFFKGRDFEAVAAKHASFVHSFQFVAVKLCCSRVIALLHRFVLKIVHSEELKRGKIPTVNEYS